MTLIVSFVIGAMILFAFGICIIQFLTDSKCEHYASDGREELEKTFGYGGCETCKHWRNCPKLNRK